MKKILQVTGSLVKGGTEAYIFNNYEILNKKNVVYDFFVLNPEISQYYSNIVTENGGKIILGKKNNFFYTIFYIIYFFKILRENGPYDAIHCHICYQNALFIFIAWLFGVKIRISHFHSQEKFINFKGLYRALMIFIISIFSTDILSCSKLVEDTFIKFIYNKKKCKIIKNGININKFFRDTSVREKYNLEFNINNDTFILGNITRYDDNKNQHFAIDILKEILIKIPNAILLLGGKDGGTKDILIDYSKKINIFNNIRFLDVRDDVNSLLSVIDAYIFPSKNEGFGFASIEAQIANCDCYVNKDGVTNDIDMGFDKVYFLSLNESPSDWANEVIDNYKKNIIVSNDIIYNYVTDKGYNIENSATKLLEIYNGN